MKKIAIVAVFAILLSGCFTTRPTPILTSSEQSWYIPKDTVFQAKKKATEPLLSLKAEDDLIVLYMGKYLELEKQADKCSK
jgi:hypothetical protein